jgi:uncharacterized membrane protein YfcA
MSTSALKELVHMNPTTSRRVAAGLIGVTGLLHIFLTPEYLSKTAYIGLLFLAGGIVATACAARLWSRDDRLAWRGGMVTALGMAVGLILSRTTGLPAFHEADWEPSALLSLLTEAGFLAIAFRSLSQVRQVRPRSLPV